MATHCKTMILSPKPWNRPFFNDPAKTRWVYVAACVLVSLKIMFLETCDNYDCFQASHFHLVKQWDLYLMFPAEHHTEYNYSPFFAWLMGAFAYLPNKLGILVWNLFNLFPFLLAVRWLPLDKTQQNFLYWFCLIEYITAAENVQTNATVAACIMLVVVYQMAGSTSRAAFFLVAGAFFKIYVLTAGVFFLLYPKRGRFFLQALGWALLFFAAPLTLVSLDQLLFLYSSWFQRLQLQTVRDSLSLTGLVERAQVPGFGQGATILLGLATVLLPLFFPSLYQQRKKQLQYLALVLMFTVVFNPGVESPSYIIALPGVALWYVLSEKNRGQFWLL
ncbi:MAG: DUF2029 domain-containing protein, partial [Sphingobacteriia bacterium]